MERRSSGKPASSEARLETYRDAPERVIARLPFHSYVVRSSRAIGRTVTPLKAQAIVPQQQPLRVFPLGTQAPLYLQHLHHSID